MDYKFTEAAKNVIKISENFAKEINRLLQEWPEHPVLLQVRTTQQTFGEEKKTKAF